MTPPSFVLPLLNALAAAPSLDTSHHTFAPYLRSIPFADSRNCFQTAQVGQRVPPFLSSLTRGAVISKHHQYFPPRVLCLPTAHRTVSRRLHSQPMQIQEVLKSVKLCLAEYSYSRTVTTID